MHAEISRVRWYCDHVVHPLLGCAVDVVTDGGLSPYLREQILRDAVPLDPEAP